jgi:hypothetical protein
VSQPVDCTVRHPPLLFPDQAARGKKKVPNSIHR